MSAHAAVNAVTKVAASAVTATATATATPPATTSSTFQLGLGRIVATAVQNKTRLTKITHRSPTRLIPLKSSLISNKGAAICVLSNYGGGMLQGDVSNVDITVQENAILGVTTQGANRIYKSPSSSKICETQLKASIQPNGLLVMAPDPCVLFSSSKYKQTTEIELQDETSSVVWVDWFSAGRVAQGEIWDYDLCGMQSSLSCKGQRLFLESIELSREGPKPTFDAFASITLSGPKVKLVEERFQTVSKALMAKRTSTRGEEPDDLKLGIGGDIIMSTSKIDDSTSVVRVVAQSNEDIYRALNFGLHPLKNDFGIAFYQDRIQSTSSHVPIERSDNTQRLWNGKISRQDSSSSLIKTSWASFVMVDSALPTGAFAHSSGIEAASQLGLLKSDEDIQNFVSTSTISTLQMLIPFVCQGFRGGAGLSSTDELMELWKELDEELDARYVSNNVARLASIDQGGGLLRVVSNLQPKSVFLSDLQDYIAASSSPRGHLGSLFGFLVRDFGITNEKQVFDVLGFTVARDIISAAVRLNLIGPLSSVRMLEKVETAVAFGIKRGQNTPVQSASGCAPVIDAIQPCHEHLAVRLFRS